jgi:hypothetical protein
MFLCVEKGADKGWPLDRSQETRKIMRQSPCFTLLHALAFLADSQQFDEKILIFVRNTKFYVSINTDQANLLTTLKEQVIEHDMWSYASLRETHA